MVDLLHRQHRREGALGLLATRGKSLGERARGDLPVHTPAVFAPTALALLPTVANDRIPVAVGFFLRVGGDLEREGLGVREGRPAVQTDAGDAADGEMDDQYIARLARGIVGGRAQDGCHLAVGKDRSIKSCSFLGLSVVPNANRVLCDVCHIVFPFTCLAISA